MHKDYLSAAKSVGTFAWSAPEVLMGGRCSEKVDVFSYGVVLWELCTGESPVRGRLRPVRCGSFEGSHLMPYPQHTRLERLFITLMLTSAYQSERLRPCLSPVVVTRLQRAWTCALYVQA